MPRTTEERNQLKRTFESVASTYQEARPEYPDELFDDLASLARLTAASRLLEVGPGSGKATLPLARRGYAITCVELGEQLAATTAATLAGFPRVRVEHGAFESWVPTHAQAFDLVYAATAWHWIDPEVRFTRAHDLLAPGGHLALWDAIHVFPDGGDPFFFEIQPVYESISQLGPRDVVWRRPGEVPDSGCEIVATGLFSDVEVVQYDWETVHDAESYIALISTFSSHIAMAEGDRQLLFGEIRRRLAARPDGLLRRHWGSALQVATKVERR